MKKYPLPKNNTFDGTKFKLRYSLGEFAFWADAEFLYVPDNLPDDPPIFEAPGPKPKTTEERLVELEAKTVNLPLPVINVGGNPH